MTDALHEYAHLAALALRDITDPDATQHAADEALAALEQHVRNLPITHRLAGERLAGALHRMHSKQTVDLSDAAESALRWLDLACRWPHMDHGRGGGVNAGKCLERASVALLDMPPSRRELRELLRCVWAAVDAELLLADGKRGGGHVRAA